MRIFKLENSIQNYAWGSADGFEQCLGIPNPSGVPAAELWMGAHPKALSMAIRGSERVPLDRLIGEDPAAYLGTEAADRFGRGLPFLFKALSAARPLSIQAHPAKRKAERGFDRENLQGIPVGAPERNYRDSNHKPEMTVALTRFEGLCGFRPVAEIIENIKLVTPESHARFSGRLERNPGRIELSVFFYSLISLAADVKRTMIGSSTKRITRLLESGQVPGDKREAFEWVLRLEALYPGDIGALMPILFNHIVMEPGEGLYIAPGEPHAYLRGTALEIMANSDNVIRGALTEKHIDIPELVSVLTFNPTRLTPALPRAMEGHPEESLYAVEAPDFMLSRIRLSESARELASNPRASISSAGENYIERLPQGPEILLCLGPSVEIRCADKLLELERGESAFVSADAGSYRLRGSGEVFRASVPSREAAAKTRS